MSLTGRLEDLALADIFQILSIGRKTGTFIIGGSKGTAVVVFKSGLIVRAETDEIGRSLGEDILDAGLIKETVFSMAVEVKTQLPSKPIAEILYEFGSVSMEIIESFTKKRIVKVMSHLLAREDGDFRFEPDKLEVEGMTDLPDLGWELSTGLSPEYLLMEGARVYDESSQSEPSGAEEFSVEDSLEGQDWEEDWEEQPADRTDLSSLKSLTQELRFPDSAPEITLLILRFASDIFQRGVLFMVGKHEMVGLGQFGLEIDNPDEKVRETALDIDRSNFFKKIILEQMPYKGVMEKDEVTLELLNELGGTWPSESAVFPVIADGDVVALLYCDNPDAEESICETDGLDIFINQAGLALEKSLLKRKLHEMEQRKDTA